MQNNDVKNELGKNFIEYAVACNTDRAIPDSKSGLKPVAKRILYDMYINGNASNKPHVKCARIYGDVMGKFHPHGDSSIYGALVRLSQPWIMRYPLIDFHGNQGNIAGDGPAAGRYTEARLSKITEDGMLVGIKKKNVDFIPNYDETEDEPVTLPSIFPNLLCNPNTGIGVAMACNWLPHNLLEVSNAIMAYLNGEEPMLPGPDFPTGGTIINSKDIPNIMKTGHGSVKLRGRYKIEKNNIVFYEIPYGQTIEDLLAEIGEVCNKKEIDGIEEIRDESNKNGIRIVIECEKGQNLDAIAAKLFLKTNLQVSISYNQIALIDKTPTELNLKDCCEIYVKHNIDCIKRETQFDLIKAKERLHIIEGLLKALEDIDNIIALIKGSKNSSEAKSALISKYNFSEEQAKAILDMKLAKLANLERIEIEQEAAELTDDIDYMNALLASDKIQREVLITKLSTIVNKYSDARRTELTNIEIPKEEKEIEAVIPEDVVVIVSRTGNVKRIPANSFKIQKRNGKGVKNENDTTLAVISTNTIDALMLFTDNGKMYRLLVDNIPQGTMASAGVNVNNILKMDANEKVIAATSLYRNTTAKYVVFFTKKGLIKKTSLEEFSSVKKTTGIIAIKLKEEDSIANVTFLNEEEVIVISKLGMSIHFATKDIAAIGRATSGVKAIGLSENDEVLVGLPIHNAEDELAIFTESGMGKKVSLKEFPSQGRGGKGVKCSSYVLAAAAMVSDEDNLLLIGKPNNICISAKDIPSLSRVSLGNIMVNGSKIVSAVKI